MDLIIRSSIFVFKEESPIKKIKIRVRKIVERYKGVGNLFVLLTFLLLGFVLNLFYEAPEVLSRERRKAAERPALIKEMSGTNYKWNRTFSSEFEAYALDHFMARETFQSIKAYTSHFVLRQKDYHGIYAVNGNAGEKEQLNKISVVRAAEKISAVQSGMPPNMNYYYGIIPDKGYYLEQESGVPSMDYDYVAESLEEELAGVDYVNLFLGLSADSYYYTDLHWRQEKLSGVVEILGNEMSFEPMDFDEATYKECEPFYGVYYGKPAVSLSSEVLIYMVAPQMNHCKVEYLNPKTMEWEEGVMYDETLFSLSDPYDIYLKGAQPVITIENKYASEEKELYLFRDSFGSSLAPLLSVSYKKMTLIDLRYISDSLLKELVEFNEGADVLFLYSMQVLNDSSLLLVK